MTHCFSEGLKGNTIRCFSETSWRKASLLPIILGQIINQSKNQRLFVFYLFMWKTVTNKCAQVTFLTKVLSRSFRIVSNDNAERQGGLWKRSELCLGCDQIPNDFSFYNADHYYGMVFSLHENVENLYPLIRHSYHISSLLWVF